MTAELAELTARLGRRRRTLDRLVGEARTVAAAGVAVTTEIAQLTDTVTLHERANAVLAGIGEQRQHTLQNQIETLVTRGLVTIFDDPDLSFHLIAGTRGKRADVTLVLRSRLGDTIVDTDLDARAGGHRVVVAFLLRLVIAMLTHTGPGGPLLLLDESFAHVSAEYLPRVAGFIRELVDLTGAQVILVTHSPEFGDVADVTHRFTNTGGVTTVTST